LIEVLGNSRTDAITRGYAFESLIRLRTDANDVDYERVRMDILPDLVMLVNDSDVDETTRYEAVGSIGAVGGPTAIDILKEFVASIEGDEPDPPLVGSAIMSLGTIGGPETDEILEGIFSGTGLVFDILYEWAADALGMIGDETAIQALERVVRDENLEAEARVQAARVLGIHGRERALPALEAALRDPEADTNVLLRTLRALSGIRTEAASRVIERTITNSIDPMVRGQALSFVGAYRSMNPTTVISVAEALLGDSSDEHEVERYELLWRLAPQVRQATGDAWLGWRRMWSRLTVQMMEQT
jgi:hypothetical protein